MAWVLIFIINAISCVFALRRKKKPPCIFLGEGMDKQCSWPWGMQFLASIWEEEMCWEHEPWPQRQPLSPAPTGFPRCASEDLCHSMSWLLLGFCWQCCTCKCFLFLPEPLKGCQPMPWVNVWVEADTWDVVSSSRRDSNCLSPLKPEQKGASLAFLWNSGIWLLHCKNKLLLLKGWAHFL